MEREAVLVTVAAALCGLVVWLSALPVGRAWPRTRHPEHLAWWWLVLPLFAGGVVLAFLLGWALQEPDPADEHVGIPLYLLAVLTGGIALRAIIRSAKALRSSARAKIPIGTIGLVKPQVVVSDDFRRIASGDVLAAALTHETAHVKRRDPLRIWLAQLAADLQWPIPGTARRFSAWLLALEAERDNEAVASGAAAEDLAEAILTAARLQCGASTGLAANAAGGGDGIAWRVRRLLSPDVSGGTIAPRRAFLITRASCTAVVIGAVWLGLTYGEAVLSVLPGMAP